MKRFNKYHIPSTKKEALYLMKQMLGNGLLSSADLLELEAKTMIDNCGLQNTESVSFAEAVLKLKEANFDLERLRVEAVHMHEQWGLINALRVKGVLSDSDHYGALFDKVRFSAEGLRQIVSRLQSGEKWIPIFNPGFLTPVELWKILIEDSGIPYWRGSYGIDHLSKLKKINPADVKDLKSFHEKSIDAQIEAFRDAYQKAPFLMPEEPSILFTPNILEVVDKGKSAIQHVNSALNGAKFSDPVSDWIRWRTQYEYTGQRPDSRTVTQYPLYLFADGDVACFSWVPVYDKLILVYYNPAGAIGNLGPRPVLA